MVTSVVTSMETPNLIGIRLANVVHITTNILFIFLPAAINLHVCTPVLLLEIIIRYKSLSKYTLVLVLP